MKMRTTHVGAASDGGKRETVSLQNKILLMVFTRIYLVLIVIVVLILVLKLIRMRISVIRRSGMKIRKRMKLGWVKMR